MPSNYETRIQAMGSYVLIASAIIPGACVAGFFPAWNVLPTYLWLVIASVGAGLGGWMAAPPQQRFAGLAGGIVSGVGIVAAIYAYVMLRAPFSGTFLQVEMLIPFFIGALPGIGVYFLFSRLLTQPDKS